MQKRIIPAILAVALAVSIFLSVLSIHDLQGNARVINYAGVVRGATQRLVKQELSGNPNDGLIEKLDGILEELATGEGENGLHRMEDKTFQDLVAQMQSKWGQVKEGILQVRAGGDRARLYEESEAFFDLADSTVFAAEAYSERQVKNAERTLLLLGAVFLLLCAGLAWTQARRRRALREAEEKNRAESEKLARMTEDLRAPMDEISELMYVADLQTHDLLFLNEAGRKTFGVTGGLPGKKCYEVLQGKDSPCEFCSTPFLVPGENYTWEFTNPLTQKHYLLKDRLLQWEGRAARLEIAFDITEAEAEKQALKNTLDAEQAMIECVRTLYQEHDVARSFPLVLQRMGAFLEADRVCLSTVQDGALHCDFEWGREGAEPQINLLKELPWGTAERWQPLLSRRGCLVLEEIESLRETAFEDYRALHAAGVHSMVVAPLEQDGRLRGVLVIYNAPAGRMSSIAPVLQTLCYFLVLTYDRTQSEQQLSQLSYYDTLTSFYNRNRYIEDAQALSDYPGSVGIVYLDVNGLKDINDCQGHAAGDQALVECARQMRETFQEADFYRIGGDEFVIICPGIERDVFEARTAALRLRFERAEHCRAAVGAKWAQCFDDVRQVIAEADAKMYEDKKTFYRRNPVSHRYRHLSDEVLHLSDPAALEEEIRRDRFVVYLQPKVSSADRAAVGAEALVRYRSNSGSLMLPGNFLPMLEESRTISQIDFYVFEYACSRLQEWAARGKESLPIAVNFSRSSLSQPDFVPRLVALCEEYGVERKYLEIELTETAHEEDGVDLKSLIHALRKQGFVVSIDDFGTEYANLALLSTVDFDVLKLDKSLVDDVAHSYKARTVVENIVNICGKMDISVVAEGIETEEQLEALRGCGVKLVQGFLFSRPIPIEEYEAKYL